MSKPFPYWIRLSVVSSLSMLLLINPAHAGRLLGRWKCGAEKQECAPTSCAAATSCGTAMSSCMPSMSACDSSAVNVPACGCSVPAYSNTCDTDSSGSGCAAGCDAMPAESMMHSDATIPQSMDSTHEGMHGGMPSDVTPVEGSPTPAVPNVSTEDPAVVAPDVTSRTGSSSDSAKVVPVEPMPTAPETTTKPLNDAENDVSTPEPKANGLDGNLDSGLEPTDEPNDEMPPAPLAPPELDDDKKPAPDDTDIFGNPADEPAADPATEKSNPPATDDLFGNESETPDTMAKEPAADPIEPPKSAVPADDLFGTPETEPVPPAPKAPDNSAELDDLFGDEAPKTEPPKKKLSESETLNDLFNSTSPQTSPDEELTGSNETSRAVSTEVKDDDFDALFGTPDASQAKEVESPTKVESDADKAKDTKTKEADEFDDLFSASNVESNPAEFRGAEFRAWKDDSGEYSVNARLSMIFPDRVRLLKDTGKYTTVPMDRLSRRDAHYVTWVAMHLQAPVATKLVNTKTDPGTPTSEVTR